MPAKKQVTRERILEAGLELLREGGAQALNVKELARRLNCSTQPIYLSFAGMDALRMELTGVCVDFFVEQLQADGGEPELFGLPYLRFALWERGLFSFLFLRENAYSQLRDALQPIIEASIVRIMARYGIDHAEAHHFHDQLWMHAHGIASMIATGFCLWDMDKVERMLRECRQYLERKYTMPAERGDQL